MAESTNSTTAEVRPSASRLRFHAGEMARGLGHAAQSGTRLIAELVTLSPLAVVIALAAFGAWWHEHNQHLRQAGEFQQLKKQTAADVVQLQSQAAQATEEANRERAGRIVALELERQKSERDSTALRQRLAALEAEERQQAAQAAALPAPQMTSDLASRLGLAPGEFAPAVASAASATAAPGEGAGAASEATRAPVAGTAPPAAAYFRVSEATLRKVDAALVSLDGCRRQSQVKDGLLADCQAQSQSSAAISDEQKASLAKLNEALADKDQILAKRETEHQAELKAVRGTFASRVVHTLEHVGIGVAIGLVVRR